MKVKKKKEQWQAARYDGYSGVSADIRAEFDYAQEENYSGSPHLSVSRYNPDKRQWENFDVQIGQWFVWSNYGKIKVLDQETFEEKFEEDV